MKLQRYDFNLSRLFSEFDTGGYYEANDVDALLAKKDAALRTALGILNLLDAHDNDNLMKLRVALAELWIKEALE